ncbi:Putative AMP-dependent synthetase/ligase, ANL domain-containing protein [Septoria linicola]|uniref:AMP-dependent synthetase/ligase, ANL domain-containing protein n=1 Tax=Septoria linicola TaxID=215465 RepID=A0A9Q9AY42_9PEZI|nr:putative AMP-dependent synthetase/ligase, ANL domain-containing protein [Septoria linicola]USW57544.1 Putative AMP-dependent synthetase/ligase, ANL domain-containing protein [Septoria linicola]
MLLFENIGSEGRGSTETQNFEDPNRPALCLCTSGTTGVPKAILLSSRGFLNCLGNQSKTHGVKREDVILQQSNLGFDMAIAEALLAMTHGSTLVIAPQSSRGDPVAVTSLMVEEDVTFTFAYPTEYLMWIRYCVDNLSQMRRWRLAHCGGKKVPDALRRELRQLKHIPVFADAYGPTDISICVTMEHDEDLVFDPLAAGATCVGRPVANVGCFILDAYGHVCPPGVPGEICVTGAGVALGYAGAEATAKSFVEDFQIPDGVGISLSQGKDVQDWRSRSVAI